MWTCRGAAVGIVTKLVDVETTQGVGVMAGDIPGNDRWVGVGSLLESDGARDVGITAEDSDYRRRSMPRRLWSASLLFSLAIG